MRRGRRQPTKAEWQAITSPGLVVRRIPKPPLNSSQTLDAKLRDAKAEKAQEVSELAAPLLASLRAFYQVDEDAKVLKPYRQQPAQSGDKPQDMLTIIGVPQTTANAFGADRIAGMERGTLEGVIRSLINLPASFADQEREVAA